jgi:hypothetical protein
VATLLCVLLLDLYKLTVLKMGSKQLLSCFFFLLQQLISLFQSPVPLMSHDESYSLSDELKAYN